MQHRYTGRLTMAGDWMSGVVYVTFNDPTKEKKRRGKKWRESDETRKKLNERHAREKFSMLVHNNFDRTSIVIHPTFDDDNVPSSEAEFRKKIRNYIAKLRRLFKKHGVVFKWIYSACLGNENSRPHLHIIVSGGVSRDEIEDAWEYGRVNSDRLQFNECGVIDLTTYIEGNRHASARRWSGSRNLVKPVEKNDKVAWSRKKLKYLMETGQAHKFFADTYPGYWLSEPPTIFKNPINGTYYMTFLMYKPDSENLEGYVRKRNRY